MKPNEKPLTAAVILAGGCGSRMPSPDGKPKQLREIGGKPLFLYTVDAFSRCDDISEIVLVSRPEDLEIVHNALKSVDSGKIRAVVVGGTTRRLSAEAGFLAISDEIEYVAVHDAARCCITPEDISAVVRTAYEYGAAVLGIPVTDTVKRVDADGFIVETVPRKDLLAGATPQVFRRDVYKKALRAAESFTEEPTDDSLMVENIGVRVKTVLCRSDNFKVTTEADLVRAEILLKGRMI